MGVGMNFYTFEDIETNLPVTRYKGNITGTTRLDDKAIAFTQELPLGDSRQRIIPSDSLFIGRVEDAIKFYSNEPIAIGYLDVIESLIFENTQLQLNNNQLHLDNNQLSLELESTHNQLTSKLESVNAANNQLQSEMENLKSENENLRKDKLLLEKVDSERNDVIESLIFENTQLQLNNNQLQSEMENLKSENENLRKDKLPLEKVDSEINSLALSSINILNRFL